MRTGVLIACICEGNAEEAIMELLLEHRKLIFSREDLLEEKIIRERSGKRFEQIYLSKGFTSIIEVVRILDSRNEKFKLSKAYREKIAVKDYITPPEIEMLIIHAEGKYEMYKKSKMTPSVFCMSKLGLRNVKSAKFINKYFTNIDTLVEAIRIYKRKAKINKGEKTICDLLK